MQARLQDGCVLRLTITRTIKRKAKPKRKYTKINDRVQDEVQVALRVPADRYPHLDRMQTALPADRLPGNAHMTLTGCRVLAQTVALQARTLQWQRVTRRGGTSEVGAGYRVTGNSLASLMAFVYAGLSRCRAEEAAPGAR
jgi:hypothetical protein